MTVKEALDTLKAAGCEIEAKQDSQGSIVLVAYIPLEKVAS